LRGSLGDMSKELVRGEKLSKREYLESGINADHHDMPKLEDHDYGNLKVQD